jgi:hypothetical protein
VSPAFTTSLCCIWRLQRICVVGPTLHPKPHFAGESQRDNVVRAEYITALLYCLDLAKSHQLRGGVCRGEKAPMLDLRALASIIVAYSANEFLTKRIVEKRIEKGASSIQIGLRWGGLLFLTLSVLTAGYGNAILWGGYAVTSLVYAALQTMENRLKESESQRKSLELYLARQLLTSLLLYAAWRVSLPLEAAEWSASAERWLFGTSGAIHEYLSRSFTRILLITACYLFMIDGGTRIVKGILEKFPSLYEKALASLRTDPQSGPTENAGEWIGILERLLALTFVLTGSYSAIAFALTAKSIARFKELEDKSFAEYYLLGTSASIVCAVVVGVLAKTLLNL